MKNKKILSLILSFVMVFTSVIASLPDIGFAASLSAEDYENAKTILNLICEDFPLEDSEVTTRAEFTSAVAKIINTSAVAPTEAPFGDVPADNIYASDIAYAKGLGLVSNVDLFYPESPVTYAQAIKIVMTAIGYGKKAEYTGGYPTGYLMAARDAKIGNTLALSNDDTLTHAQSIELIFEAACADMIEPTGFGTTYEYSITEGKNLLSVYHKLYMAEGIVEATEFTGLHSASYSAGEDAIEINKKIFHGEGYGDLIGRNARIFFRNDSKNTIVYGYGTGNKETVYTKKDGVKILGLTLSATPESAMKTVKHNLDGEYSVIYNGKFLAESDYTPYLQPSSGTVTLTDNNDDGKIDTISIKEISYGVIGNVNIFEERIYDKYQKNGMVDFAEMDYYTICDSDGAPLELEDLEAGDVLGFVKSQDSKLVSVTRYRTRVGGIFDAKGKDGKLYIGDREFELSAYYQSNIKTIEQLSLGTEIIVHLGEDDVVVYIEEFTGSVVYGYAIDAGIDNPGGISEEKVLKLFSEDGEIKIHALADKVKINGVSKNTNDAYTEVTELCAQSDIYKVVKYAVNNENKISKLYTTTMNTIGATALTRENVNEAQPVLFDDNTAHGHSSSTLFLKNSVFYPYFKSADDVVVMQVPPSGSQNVDNDKYYSLSSVSLIDAYADTTNENQLCYGYDVDKNGAAFILWTLDGAGVSSVGESTATGIVERITTGANEDGDVVKVVRMYSGKEWKKFYAKTDAEYTSLGQTVLLDTINKVKPGDIVRISADSEDSITAMRIDFYYDTKVISDGSVSAEIIEIPNYGGKVVGYAGGYVYTYGNGVATLARHMTLDEIEANADNMPIVNIFPANLNRGTTVFVKLIRDAQTNAIESANVYTEGDLSTIESFFSAGSSADYVVQRSRYLDVSMNIIYVN